MYQNKLVVAAMANGKVLREFGETVYLPFGTEYSLLIKNKNTVRASVKVEIDGTDVTEGVSLVIDPNDEIELERFIKNGNLSQGNRFKFIERTAKISQHRGVRAEDGLIRITYQFEKIKHVYVRSSDWDQQVFFNKATNGLIGNSAIGFSDSTEQASYSVSSQSIVGNLGPQGEVGITAPGSISDQEFLTVSAFELEPQKHVIIMKLLGEHEGKAVTSSVTTRSRTTCVTCGHRSRNTAKFCSQCGTSLQIIE